MDIGGYYIETTIGDTGGYRCIQGDTEGTGCRGRYSR